MYAVFTSSPILNQGICLGGGIDWAAALFSPFLVPCELPLRPILEPGREVEGEGDGTVLTKSASELGV